MSKKAKILLFLTLLLGSFLRLYKFKETLILSGDNAMAFLLADRIINHGHILLVGPFTSVWQMNLLPPTYYYLITILFFILKSEMAVSLTFAVAGILSIILLFLLGKDLFDTKTGLIAAFLYAISITLVWYSRNVWEPHLIPFFILLALYLLYLSKKRKSVYLFLLSIVSFFISLMYISSFLLIPSFYILSVSIFRKTKPESRYPWLKITIIFIILFLLLYLPVFYFEIKNNYPSFQYLNKLIKGQTTYFKLDLLSFLNSFSTHVDKFIQSIFLGTSYYTIIFFLPYILINLKLILRAVLAKSEVFTLYIIFATAIFLTAFYHGKVETYRLASIYPIFFLLFGYVINKAIIPSPKNSSSYLVFTIFIFLYLMNFLINNISSFNGIAQRKEMREFKRPFKVAEYILNSSKNEDFSIYTITPDEKGNHHSTSYLYAMEKITGRKIASLNKQGNWIEQKLNKKVKRIYLICRDFPTVSQAQIKCLDYFIGKERLNPPKRAKFFENEAIYLFTEAPF